MSTGHAGHGCGGSTEGLGKQRRLRTITGEGRHCRTCTKAKALRVQGAVGAGIASTAPQGGADVTPRNDVGGGSTDRAGYSQRQEASRVLGKGSVRRAAPAAEGVTGQAGHLGGHGRVDDDQDNLPAVGWVLHGSLESGGVQ